MVDPMFACPRGHQHLEGSAFCTVCGAGPVLEVSDAALSRETTRREESWMLVERYVASYPHDWALVFKKDDELLEVFVPEEVWRAFDV